MFPNNNNLKNVFRFSKMGWFLNKTHQILLIILSWLILNRKLTIYFSKTNLNLQQKEDKITINTYTNNKHTETIVIRIPQNGDKTE